MAAAYAGSSSAMAGSSRARRSVPVPHAIVFGCGHFADWPPNAGCCAPCRLLFVEIPRRNRMRLSTTRKSMGNVTFSWESLLGTDAPKGCSLKAALFTTYDRAEERFLAEHLLPFLLRLCREPGGEGAERQYFLLELDRRLKQLHDRLVVVSSTTREEPGESIEAESGTYGWIWRSIRQLTVGSRDKAVQHAKLWLLHWGAADDNGVEYLELVVS